MKVQGSESDYKVVGMTRRGTVLIEQHGVKRDTGMQPEDWVLYEKPKLDYAPRPRLLRLQDEEMRSATSAARMLGALLVVAIFVAGGLVFALLERFLTR